MDTIKPTTPDAERTAGSLHRDCCASWGLWHSGKDRWLTYPLSDAPMTFDTKGEAAAAKVRITRGKRDVNSNWLRIAVKIRRFTRHNVKVSDAPDSAAPNRK